MKVITPGRPQNGWAQEFTCTGAGNGNGGCGAVLLVEQCDLYQTSSSCRDETDYYTTFQCSECGVETDIKDVPIREALPSKETWEKAKKKATCIYILDNGEQCQSLPKALSNYCCEHISILHFRKLLSLAPIFRQ